LRALSNRPQSTLHTLWLRSPQGGAGANSSSRGHTKSLESRQCFRSHRQMGRPFAAAISGHRGTHHTEHAVRHTHHRRAGARRSHSARRFGCHRAGNGVGPAELHFSGSRTTQRRLPSSPQGGAAFIAPTAPTGHVQPEMQGRHATVIPRLTYPAPSEPGSQAPVGIVSSEMGDLSRIRCAVVFWFSVFPRLAPALMTGQVVQVRRFL
jgi:hypothetical protein